jgi:hypothetical protein
MKTEIKLITPKLAVDLLRNNKSNRRLNERKILQYKNDMMEGRWFEFTGETIAISENGRLLNGQHRLHAIAKSGVSLKFLICTNVSEDAMPFIDTGAARTATDIFEITGIVNARITPSIVRKYMILKEGYTTGKSTSTHITNKMILDFYKKNTKRWDFVSRYSSASYHSFSKILAPSFIGSYFALFQDISSEDAVSFFDQLCTGRDIENNTIAVLRTRLVSDKLGNRRTKESIISALLIKTWNCYRKKTEAKILKFNADTEDFPQPL